MKNLRETNPFFRAIKPASDSDRLIWRFESNYSIAKTSGR